MRIVRYVIFLNIHFFAFLVVIVILINLLRYIVSNEMFLSLVWFSGFVFNLWLSHHVAKRMVFRDFPWKKSIVDSFNTLEII